MSAAKDRGTRWESAIVNHLTAIGAEGVERRACNGTLDRGDIAGIPNVVIEAKNAARVDLAGWLDEANRERDNANAHIGAAWFKRRGHTSPAAGYVLMDGATFIRLLTDAGYLKHKTPGGSGDRDSLLPSVNQPVLPDLHPLDTPAGW